jgi:hypothetical protein
MITITNLRKFSILVSKQIFWLATLSDYWVPIWGFVMCPVTAVSFSSPHIEWLEGEWDTLLYVILVTGLKKCKNGMSLLWTNHSQATNTNNCLRAVYSHFTWNLFLRTHTHTNHKSDMSSGTMVSPMLGLDWPCAPILNSSTLIGKDKK